MDLMKKHGDSWRDWEQTGDWRQMSGETNFREQRHQIAGGDYPGKQLPPIENLREKMTQLFAEGAEALAKRRK